MNPEKTFGGFPMRSPTNARRSLVTLFVLGVVTFFLGRLYISRTHMAVDIHRNGASDVIVSSNENKVALEAHIMSKCPDALDCLRDLIVPAMEQVHDLVDFRLSYIAKPVNSDDGIECKHGPDECLGNMIELCAASVYPDPKLYLGFTLCLTERYAEIPKPDLIKHCASEHGLDAQKLNDCVSSDDGQAMELLRQSARRSLEKGALYSCTVRLNDKLRCIRDDGQWKDCDGGSEVKDLVSEIKELYQKKMAAQ